VRNFIAIVGFMALAPANMCWAQLAAGNEMGVAMGHLHLNVRDIQADKKLWLTLGPVPANQLSAAQANRETVRMAGVLITIAKQKDPPTGGSVGSIVDHVGFHVPNVQAAVAKWQAAGVTVEPGGNRRKDQAYVTSPDGLRIEILEDAAMTVPIAMHHLHLFATESVLPELRNYYVQHYGAKPGKRGNFEVANLPGVEMIFSKSAATTAPTKGRVLDHIGFEVVNLEAFSKKMQAEGVKFDREYRKQGIFGIVVLADPWGTAMELTEGQRLY
jgi:catechol 2,3-dioxygenase-like lactoylglutathione lyase family enzyme